MTPAERFRWSWERIGWWDEWVPCPACGYPTAVFDVECCDFCWCVPADFLTKLDDPDLIQLRADVERTGMAEPWWYVKDDEDWMEIVKAQLQPEVRQRKTRFAQGFEQMMRDEQSGQINREQVLQRLTELRMDFYRVESEKDLPESLDGMFRRLADENNKA